MEIVFCDYTDETPDFRQAMSIETLSTDCGDNNFPEVTYCCYVHVPRGEHYIENLEDRYRWKYYYVCDGGSREPPSGFYEFDTSTNEDCTVWGGGQCDHDFCD